MDERKTPMKKIWSGKNIAAKKIAVIVCVLFGILLVVIRTSYVNVREVEKEMQQNLADVGRQNAVVLYTKVQEKYELLTSLARELRGVTPETIEGVLDGFKIFIEDFTMKRFAFCFMDGTTYSTDGEVVNLAYRDFFQAGVKGQCYVTGVLTDAIQEAHTDVNVMTVPIYEETGEVSGVFGLAYDTENFNNSLLIESFDGNGYSCIVNEKGEIMATMDETYLPIASDFFSSVLKADERNKEKVEDLKRQMEEQIEAGGEVFFSEKMYYHCIPVDLMGGCMTWYILTFFPDEILQQRVMPIQMNQMIGLFWICVLVVIGVVLLIIFIKEQQKEKVRFAYEDSLTKGPNFAKFCLEMERNKDKSGYLVVMDIINFNNITITAGKAASEVMIQKSWNIICQALMGDEVAGRVREDIFLLFLTSSKEETLIQRMEAISKKISDEAKEFRAYGIQVGYGICRISGEESLDNAYGKAKLAREYARASTEHHYAFYKDIDREKEQREKQLEDDFPLALRNEEFEVWYQPKYSAADGIVVGSEALVRWKKANGEMISPGEFIPLFERNGMIMKLDEYMFRKVCRQQKKWLEEGKTILPVSINVSRASLYSIDVEQRYCRIMEESNIAPQYIQLEVTETVMEDKKNVCELLNRFRQMGIKILMDDFGTGYSSLATLSNQCFDTLKLDKSLIDHIGSRNGETLLYHVIRMGQQMGLHITAEGVEKQFQVEYLQHLNCDDIQGYYFSKPIPQTEYEMLLDSY